MSDDLSICCAVGWTLLGAICCSLLSLLLADYVQFFELGFVTTRQGERIVTLLRGIHDHFVFTRPDSHQETTTAVVEELRNAWVPLGEPPAEALRDELQELRDEARAMRIELQSLAAAFQESLDTVMGLRTDLQELASALLEIPRILNGLRTDMQLLATAFHEVRQALTIGLMTDSQEPVPVLLEILTQLRRSERGDLMVQRTLPGFSFSGFAGTAYAEVLARERAQATPSSIQDLD